MTELTYGVRVRVTKDITTHVGAMTPKAGTEGVVINASKPLIVCEFQSPYQLAAGGMALPDPEHGRGPDGRGIRVYFTADDIEVIN